MSVNKNGDSILPSSTEPAETGSMVGDKYIVVRRSDYERKVLSEDRKSSAKNAAGDAPATMCLAQPVLTRTARPMALSAAMRGSKVRTNAPIKVILWQKIAQSQSTTALVTASALQPSSGLAYNDFSDIYDLVRCTKIEFHCRAIDGSLPGVSSWAAAFDPATSGNLSSVILALEQRQHVGPIALSSGASQGPTTGVASSTGYYRFDGKTEKVFQSSATNDLVGSNWYPSTTTSSIVGYLKPYVENAGGGTVYLTTYVGYHLEFKVRG
jgi:hypothetical protein